jgi:lysozyme
MIKGIDISHFNAPFPWANLSHEVKFVFCKATQGATYKDPEFNNYWQHLKTTDLKRGAYHFLTATDSAQKQADNFLSLGIDFSKPGVLPPVLDVEDQVPVSLNKNITSNKAAFIQLITDWLLIVEKETGRKPIIYSYKTFFNDYLNNHSWPNNGLWLASYQEKEPALPKGYDNYTFWQNSQYGTLDGRLTGGGLDMDFFNGDMNALNAISNMVKIDHFKNNV